MAFGGDLDEIRITKKSKARSNNWLRHLSYFVSKCALMYDECGTISSDFIRHYLSTPWTYRPAKNCCVTRRCPTIYSKAAAPIMKPQTPAPIPKIFCAPDAAVGVAEVEAAEVGADAVGGVVPVGGGAVAGAPGVVAAGVAAHEAAVGKLVTPLIEQRLFAKAMALFWSSSEQAVDTQQEMSLRN
ncbi:hypothetical protein HYFRA_00006969 [Hymenoscyphus fraxineus]|uniref:Uncharacterized protein n=1 Tax=Hymenoscyphus fraxineus TaxID=746836 RepID=A0A9N9KRX9_9HELO|nr:hypothetical protein HYFRA_00006969 [Hymenoscyphus fraxineus]